MACVPMSMNEPRSYTARVLIAVGIVVLAWLAWQLMHVTILAFGALVIGTALRTLSVPLQRWMSPRLSLLLVLALLLLVAVVGSALLGGRLSEQLATLREVLPQALDQTMRWLRSNPVGGLLLEAWDQAKDGGEAWSRIASLAGMTLGGLGAVLLMLFAGIYLAADPALYRRGLLHLVPVQHRLRVDEALQAAGDGLSRWLLGQGVSMLVIGTLTTVGLLLLGIPLALTLGIIAGVLAFVPFFGAITAGALIVMLAFTQAPEQAMYALVLVVAVQQIEEFLILPFVHRWSVRMPPALGLMAVVIFSLLFGILGSLFATPLMVVVMILVRKLYVQAVVENGKPAPMPVRREAPG